MADQPDASSPSETDIETLSAAGTSASDFDEAESLHRKALEMNRRIRPDHPYLGDNLSALAHLRHRAGEDKEAEKPVRDALRIYRLKLSEEHSKIVCAKRGLAEILVAQRRPLEAEPLLLECHRALAGKSENAKDLEAVDKSLAQVYGLLGKPALAAQYRPPSNAAP